MFVCVLARACAHMCVTTIADSPKAEVTGGCEPLGTHAENHTLLSSARAANALHWCPLPQPQDFVTSGIEMSYKFLEVQRISWPFQVR